MRTYRAYSFISRIIPSVYMTLSGIILIGLVFVCFAIRCNHVKGIKKISGYGIIMFLLGMLIIGVASAATNDAKKYTRGTKKTMAIVTKAVEEYPMEGSSTYTYTIEFSYEDEQVSVIMNPTHSMKLKKGNHLEVYFYPEEIGEVEYPIVVAVDLELKQARGNINVGFFSCVMGVMLLLLASCKQNLLCKGIHTSAIVRQIEVEISKSDNQHNSIEKTLICEGTNPGTGMLQTFSSCGGRNDFRTYTEGDIVLVYIHKRCSKFYVINV